MPQAARTQAPDSWAQLYLMIISVLEVAVSCMAPWSSRMFSRRHSLHKLVRLGLAPACTKRTGYGAPAPFTVASQSYQPVQRSAAEFSCICAQHNCASRWVGGH